MSKRVLPLFALLAFVGCGPKAATERHVEILTERASAPEIDRFLDPEPLREISLGKLFSPDGSIQPADRATTFQEGRPILLSVETGGLPAGTAVTVIWAGPGGVASEQRATVIGGETYLSFTAPSAGWPSGAGRVTVRIDAKESAALLRELPFSVGP